MESVLGDSVRVSFKGQALTWLMGQSLRFELEPSNQPQGVSTQFYTEENALPKLDKKPKMSLEEELEQINGEQSSVPQ